MELGESRRIKPGSACLQCGYLLDAASGVDTNAKPRPGDVSVCAKCGALAAFGADLKLRPLTPQEQREANRDLRIRMTQFAISKLHKQH